MSLYNMVNGFQPSTFFVLPMLGKHPDEYPRFRDCFIGKMYQNEELDQFGIPLWHHGKEELISVYTRTGGNNRADYEEEIQQLRDHPNYVEDFDDEFDNTFAVFVFSIPDEFKKDFKLLQEEGEINKISKKYKNQIDKVFPKLEGKLPWHKKKTK